jgi:hypothetical protein
MTTSQLIACLQSVPDSEILIYDPETGDYLAPIVDVVRAPDGRVVLSQWPLETEDVDDPSPTVGGTRLFGPEKLGFERCTCRDWDVRTSVPGWMRCENCGRQWWSKGALGTPLPTTTIGRALAGLDPSALLHELPDREFAFGGAIDDACRIAGYSESGRTTVNQLMAWNMTVAEFAAAITPDRVQQHQPPTGNAFYYIETALGLMCSFNRDFEDVWFIQDLDSDVPLAGPEEDVVRELIDEATA